MAENYYDSERAAAEYLDLHYGDPAPWPAGFSGALRGGVSRRTAAACRARAGWIWDARWAGRPSSSARHCAAVIGIDASKQFIAIAGELRDRGSVRFQRVVEGELTAPRRARVPADIDRRRVRFEVGDATNLREALGK